MYHGRFNGTHYEVGYKWGRLVLKNGKKLDHCPTFELTDEKYGFMCQYDRKQNADTVWSVAYDLKRKQIFRVEGNPSRKPFKKDIRMKLD